MSTSVYLCVQGPIQLNKDETTNLKKSLSILESYQADLKSSWPTVASSINQMHRQDHLISFSALVHNQNSIGLFVDMCKESNTFGTIHGLKVPISELAIDSNGAQVGYLIMMHLYSN